MGIFYFFHNSLRNNRIPLNFFLNDSSSKALSIDMYIVSRFVLVIEKNAKFKNDCDKSNVYEYFYTSLCKFFALFCLFLILQRCILILTWLVKSITRLSSRKKWFALLKADTPLRRLHAGLTSHTKQLKDGRDRNRKEDI